MTERNGRQQSVEICSRLLGDLRTVWLEMWQRVRIDWSFAAGGLSSSLRKRLRGEDRRIVSDALYGMIRDLSRIDEALLHGGARRADPKIDAMRLVAYLVLHESFPPEDALRHVPGVDWQRVADIDTALARESKPARRIARTHSLPDWLAEALVREYGDDAEALAASLAGRAPVTMRVNALVGDREQALARLGELGVAARAGRFSETALTLATHTNLRALDAELATVLEPQDEGSQLVTELVDAGDARLVVDYCAGAGGKSLGLAAAMAGRGRVVAVDVDARKLGELKRRAKRAGVTNVRTLPLERDGGWPRELSKLEGRAERVLVDAPCTGTGALRRNPEVRWRLQQGEAERFAERQLPILVAAADLVAPGGRLVYVTCSVLQAENQDVVDRFLAARAGFELVPVNQIWTDHRAELCDASGRYMQVLPHRHGADGFFAAVFQRATDDSAAPDADSAAP